MTSKARVQKGELAPPAVDPSSQHVDVKQRRQATVYDAVAGRINTHGFISNSPYASSKRDTLTVSSNALSPEEVLFKRRNAPDRYEETDTYFANDLLATNLLPDSDLLKALHCYASDFYGQTTADGGQGDYRSLDETALIAMGILIEESCREILGETGDMVFTEGELEDARGDAELTTATTLTVRGAARSRISRSKRQRTG